LKCFEIDFKKTEKTYQLNNEVKVIISKYYPDYELVDGEPISQSDSPLNPVFIFKIDGMSTLNWTNFQECINLYSAGVK